MRPRFLLAVFVLGLGAGLGALLPACNGGSEGEPSEDSAGASQPDASEDSAGPRRPKRRYYMTRTDTRCEVYSVEGDVLSTPAPALCPPSLEVGERLRIVGRSCFREGSPSRESPVVCPWPLILAEQEGYQQDKLSKAAEGDGGLSDGGLSDGGAGADASPRDGGRPKRGGKR